MEKIEREDMISTINKDETANLQKLKEDFEWLRVDTKNTKMEELESMKHNFIKNIENLDSTFVINFNNYVAEKNQN